MNDSGEPIYRPPSVWITQCFVMISGLSLILSIAVSLSRCDIAPPPFNCSSPFLMRSLVINFIALAIVCVTFWGLQKRKHYGKWLGLMFLTLLIISIFAECEYLQLIYHSMLRLQPLPTPPYECWRPEAPFSNMSIFCGYSSYRELAWMSFQEALPLLFIGLLAVQLIFGSAAKRFFHSVGHSPGNG
jgi:Heparan-alpha-glucosaminide N-acetyltransferase, catalytic